MHERGERFRVNAGGAGNLGVGPIVLTNRFPKLGKVAPFHLQRYVDEQAHRFNHRKTNDESRFNDVMSTVVGRRVTWRLLTAQNGAGFMGFE